MLKQAAQISDNRTFVRDTYHSRHKGERAKINLGSTHAHLRGDPSFALAKATTRRRHAWRKEGGRKGGGRAEGRGTGGDARAQQQLCAHLLGQGRAWGTYRAVPGGEAAGIGPFSTVVTKQK